MDINKLINKEIEHAYTKGREDMADEVLKAITKTNYKEPLTGFDIHQAIKNIQDLYFDVIKSKYE